MAGYTLQTTTIGAHTYVLGYSAGPTGAPLPQLLTQDNQWFDDYGNPRLELLSDGTVIYANIVPTAQQISDKQDNDWTDKAAPLLVKLIVKAIKNTAGPAQSWAAIDAAIRNLLNG